MNNDLNKKNIWIFHHYATPPNKSGLTRPYNFGVHMNKEGYDVSVFSSSYLHFSSENLIKNNELYTIDRTTDIPFVFIKTPSYINSGLKRILNMVLFFTRLFKVSKKYSNEYGTPDAIIASSPHPLTMIAGIKIAKKYKIPCICEVRDFWPEVFFTGGLLKEKSLMGKVLKSGEKWIYENSDSLIFLKEGDINYIVENKWDLDNGGKIDLKKCNYINNGVDINEFKSELTKYKLNDDDLINNKNFNVIYTGAIRPVNNVGSILDTAKLLREYKNIRFIIYGDGNELESLKDRVKNERIENVKLKGRVDKKYIPFILSKSSVNILNYSQKKYNWSRGNSSNKIFEYMASGKPIISTVKMGYCPIMKYKCGISIDNNEPKELASAILKIYNLETEKYEEMCLNSLEAAKNFDYTILTKKLISLIKS